MPPLDVSQYNNEDLIDRLVVINNDRLVAEAFILEIYDDDTMLVELKHNGDERTVSKQDIKEVIDQYLDRDIRP